MSHFFTPFLKETAIDLVRFTREVLNGISTWMERQDLWGAVGGCPALHKGVGAEESLKREFQRDESLTMPAPG